MDPQNYARKLVMDYYNSRMDKTDKDKVITIDDVYVVWFCYILNNWKALVSTTVPDNMYYEITHNFAEGETYIDAYRKWENICVNDKE